MLSKSLESVRIIIFLIQQGCIKLSKVAVVNTFIMLHRILFEMNAVPMSFLLSKNLKKMYHMWLRFEQGVVE